MGSPFNISATAEASEFKFATQLGFAKAHHAITPRRKEGRNPKLGELPKIWGFSLIFMQWLKVSTSNVVHCLGGQLHVLDILRWRMLFTFGNFLI